MIIYLISRIYHSGRETTYDMCTGEHAIQEEVMKKPADLGIRLLNSTVRFQQMILLSSLVTAKSKYYNQSSDDNRKTKKGKTIYEFR